MQNTLRSIAITPHVYSYAPGSVLLELGNTKVLCAITLQPNVPPFMRGKGAGWLTAEYSMLPASTKTRTVREISVMKRCGRSIEISRLIGRALRSVCDLSKIGERTIFIDCDVLQADGGTRTTSITGAYIALRLAQQGWLARREIAAPFLVDGVCGVSVGLLDDQIILDPNFEQDSTGQADINFVMTKSGRLVEVQGGAEHASIAWEQFDGMRAMAINGAQEWFAFIDGIEWLSHTDARPEKIIVEQKNKKAPLFSLQHRLQKSVE
jgi:ribonuclease PH